MEKDDDKTVGRASDKFMLRLPEGMREHIAALAKHNGRSMNAEIVERLEQSFETQDKTLDMLAEIRGQIDVMGRILIEQEARRAPHEKTQPPESMQALKDSMKLPPPRPVPRRHKK